MDKFHEIYMENPTFVKECMHVLKEYLEPRFYYLTDHGEWSKMKDNRWKLPSNDTEEIIIKYKELELNYVNKNNKSLSETHKSFIINNTCKLIHELFKEQKGIYRDIGKYCIAGCSSGSTNTYLEIYPCGGEKVLNWTGFKKFMNSIK